MNDLYVAAEIERRDLVIGHLRARIARLEAALHEVMPRYCEMFEALGLGDSSESIAVKIARAALEQPHEGAK